MAWSKSLNQNFKLQREHEEGEREAVYQSYSDRKKSGNVFTPSETRITSGDDAIAMKMPSKAKMYWNDASTGLQNSYLSLLQTADMLRPTHYLKEAAKTYAKNTGNDKYTKVADGVIGAIDPIGKGISDLKSIYEKYASAGQQRATEMHYMTPGKTDDYIGKGIETAAGMIPQMLAAAATGGASSEGQLAEYGTKTVGNIIRDRVINNPSSWYAFMRSAGPAFERAKSKGASDAEAFSAGILNGIFNGITETDGGIEGFKPVEGFWNFIKELGKSGFEEGAENVFQGAGEKFIEQSIYDYDKPWFSRKEEDAVINPERAINEAAAGMFGAMTTGTFRQLGHMGVNAAGRAYDAYSDRARFVPRPNERPVFVPRKKSDVQATLENSSEKVYNNNAKERRTSSLQEPFQYEYRGEKKYIPKETEINPVINIAGLNTDTELRDVNRLVAYYGGEKPKWAKCVGKIESAKYTFDMHWYEYENRHHEMKIGGIKEREEKQK